MDRFWLASTAIVWGERGKFSANLLNPPLGLIFGHSYLRHRDEVWTPNVLNPHQTNNLKTFFGATRNKAC
jgi:hypothetical protein